ncbi:MAG: hypothetical protein PHN32_09135 [Actinomycetota bacterium]|nr:hypothetical protein [Actinomycetota bacterium]
MKIEILSAESLGTRGMCCMVETAKQSILIDPGLALGYRRKNLLPHPFQVAMGAKIRAKIVNRFALATDVVFSHFHGDHVPLKNANPYQLSLAIIPKTKPGLRVWSKPSNSLGNKEKERAEDIYRSLGEPCTKSSKHLSFSQPVIHGETRPGGVTVIMTKIEDDIVFVHASDIQLLNHQVAAEIIQWKPHILFASGPPIYLKDRLDRNLLEAARENALKLSEKIETVILDHHLLRSREGLQWLDEVNSRAKHHIICAADFMNLPRRLLEADREFLYSVMPVPENWHKLYAEGKAGFSKYFRLP